MKEWCDDALASSRTGSSHDTAAPSHAGLGQRTGQPCGTYRRAAEQVARFFNGAKPGEIPVEQPNAIELAINLLTAKALGVGLPQVLRLRADRLIE